jgi:hypothetical protein
MSYGNIRTTSGLFADTITTSGGILALGSSGIIATTVTCTSGLLLPSSFITSKTSSGTYMNNNSTVFYTNSGIARMNYMNFSGFKLQWGSIALETYSLNSMYTYGPIYIEYPYPFVNTPTVVASVSLIYYNTNVAPATYLGLFTTQSSTTQYVPSVMTTSGTNISVGFVVGFGGSNIISQYTCTSGSMINWQAMGY